ncbi:MFS transporter [Thalassotalea sp. ND16A]|uniref:MFS transporter n=1 Tax=Thalassotalea sp. ND16A TaxID=1535422 RepID=UPI00051D5062|nr:MFS transporter [Thalassotalea sp. ND16A]KGJ98687.1 hypothetical protein ND16A_0014 [Thalassotalea sp. ND16A]
MNKTEKSNNLPPQTNKKRHAFSLNFYVANSMEIFERLAWYGFFTLSSLYMTSPAIQGGLAFSDQQRGLLQGMVPFLLYLLPVITGALADSYGYRRMFIISFLIMCPSYYLLGQVSSFWPFCAVFILVAIGAACFKPVVVGTVAKVTNDSNRGLGFGIFYTMVNVGGFLGPLVAGYVRVIGWDMVFIMSSLWIALNLLPAIFLYKEPENEASALTKSSLTQVLKQAQMVLGNGRFALLVTPMILGLMIAGTGAITYQQYLLSAAIWLFCNLLWDKYLTSSVSTAAKTTISPWFKTKTQIGNKPFVIYLLILTGFWTMYLQLFVTTPLFIRDFVNTTALVNYLEQLSPQWLEYFAGVNIEQLASAITQQLHNNPTAESVTTNISAIYFDLVNYKVMVPRQEIIAGLHAIAANDTTSAIMAEQWAENYRQINPEYIVNISFGCIIAGQIMISHYCAKINPLPVIVIGTAIIALAMLITGAAASSAMSGVIIIIAVIVFAFGEMIASPKSQEYVATIAPKEHSAMYMGYYFVSMALGFLFAGLLSGWSYGLLAKTMNQPMLMWSLFAGIGTLTCLALVWFNRNYIRSENNFENLAVESEATSQ